jgi:hypothetical protein
MNDKNNYVFSNILRKFADDDFSLWSVAIHENDFKAAMTDFVRVSGNPASVLKNIPIASETTSETVLHFMYHNPMKLEIISTQVDTDFISRYQNKGGSIRGSLQDILDELDSGQYELPNDLFGNDIPNHDTIYFLYDNEKRLVHCSTNKNDIYIALGNEIMEEHISYNGLTGKNGFALFRQDYRADAINDDLITNGYISESDNYLITEYTEPDEYTNVLDWLTMDDGEYERIANESEEITANSDAEQDDELER